MSPGPGRTGRLGVAAVAALAARAALSLLSAHPPGSAQAWTRVNHRGAPVSLLEGPAFTAGTVAGLSVATGLTGRERLAGLLTTLGAGGIGLYDDLAGSGQARGLRGHLRALGRGVVTSGAVKVVGIGATGLAAGALVRDPADSAFAVLESGACIALAANLVNLLDLRPGRALKVGLVCAPAALGPAGSLLLAPLAAAGALLPEDLAERAMLGDSGANALGALLGLGVVTSAGRATRRLSVAALLALTLVSEVVSFSDVIARTPALRALDELGRRP